MAFIKSAKTESMLKTVRTYLKAWGPEAAGVEHETTALLRMCVHPKGLTYTADGVVHPHNRHKTLPELVAHIRDRHAAYKHLIHDEIAAAVDEDTNTAFLGVRYVMENIGSVAGRPPTGRPSEGVLLEKLTMDDEGLITSSLVCRQLTYEEAGALTFDPSAVHTAPLDDHLLYAPQETLTAQDMQAMRENAAAWVGCWDAGVDKQAVIGKCLSDDVRQVSGYGLSRRSVPFSSAEEAKQAIQASLDSYPGNADTMLAVAIAPDRRAGFIHWQSTGLLEAMRSPESQTGLDYLRFGPDNRIAFILSFTMRPYSNVRGDEAPRADRVD